MSRLRSRSFRLLIVISATVAGLLAILHTHYPLGYVVRVYAYRFPNFDDIDRFPARPVAPAPSPGDLPVDLQPRVAAVFEQYPDIAGFDDWFNATETSALLVAHRGRLVFERYRPGDNPDTPQNTFSVSKSVMSALVGLALDDGVIELDEPITRHLPELNERDPRFAGITIRHLLDMRSGIRFSPQVAFPFINGDNPLIYYHPDLASVVLRRTQIEAPPGEFKYNNYNSPLVGLILRRSTGLAPAEFLERRLWQPMGAAGPAGWTIDDHGFEKMESGFHAGARDLLRFGLMYLNGGRANGGVVVPPRWIEQGTSLADGVEHGKSDGRAWGYRAGWWIVPRPTGRPDFSAIGRFGQFIYVSPQYDAVFVRNGPGRGGWGDRDWTALFYYVAERL